MAYTESLGKKWELSCLITHIYIYTNIYIYLYIYIYVYISGIIPVYHREKWVEIGGISNKHLNDLIRLESFTILT